MQEKTAIETMIRKAIEHMEEELGQGRGDQVLGAKVTETAGKLLAQLCITGLRGEHGWSNAELARRLSEAGPNVSPDMSRDWLAAKTMPEAARLGALLKLYMGTRGYLGGRMASGGPRLAGKEGRP